MSAKGPSQATVLVTLARERYRLARATTGEPFAVALEGPNIARMLRGGAHSLRAELAAVYVEQFDSAPSATALADAGLALEGLAMREPEEQLHLRVARDQAGLWLDLGDENGRAVNIRPGGWQVFDGAPMVFRRTKLTAPLPEPKRGGDLGELRDLLNVTDESWPMLLAFLLHALIPDEPHTVLLLSGEQGAAKSTAERLLATLIDPSGAPLRTTPKDLGDWAVAASGSYVVPLDNLSSIPPWLSDAICRASTGDGMVKRRLYSDEDLAVLSYRRVVMLSAIDVGSLRGDLADRLLLVELTRIPPEKRRRDQDVLAAFERLHAKALGALLSLAGMLLASDVTLDRMPRMADFAVTVAKMDKALDTKALDTCRGQRELLAQEVIDGDLVAMEVQRFAEREGEWKGTATDLLETLVAALKGPKGGWPEDWPKTPHHFSGQLKRAAASLRAVGVVVEFSRESGAKSAGRRTKRISIRSEQRSEPDRKGQGASPASPASPPHMDEPQPGDAEVEEGRSGDAAGDADLNTGDAGDAEIPSSLSRVNSGAPHLHLVVDDPDLNDDAYFAALAEDYPVDLEADADDDPVPDDAEHHMEVTA